MRNDFNIFRLNLMLDDNKSRNYNSILVSLIAELIFENNNSGIFRKDCYSYLVDKLKIRLQFDFFIKVIEKSPIFEHIPSENDIEIKLTKDKFSEIEKNIKYHSIDYYIAKFLKENKIDDKYFNSLQSLLHQAVYENINSFTISNINSIIPDDAENNYTKDEIKYFNDFLDDNDSDKNIALYNVFLKAIEFAILTSGKGVKEFSKGVFAGKEYLLDTNIFFRLLGVGGEERKESLINLISVCNYQGIKFNYSNETYSEFKRKLDASINDIKRATENKSIILLEELLKEDELEFNNGFITHYAYCKINKKVSSPEQYRILMQANFKTLCSKYNINPISKNSNIKTKEIATLQNDLYKRKKDINEYIHYTKTAAKVDAVNILLVKYYRKSNDYNYSDIKSFYLTTDRTLNKIIAEKNPEKIAETILPSQLFILHNALSDNGKDEDYKSFTKFLKRRTTQFKFTGKQVLSYIEEIRNYATEPENIKDILKAYADSKYETSLLDIEVEPDYKSIKDFTETYLEKKYKKAKLRADKYDDAYTIAINKFPVYLKSSINTVRLIDILLSILIIPIIIVITKKLTDDIFLIILVVLIAEAIKFLLSSRFYLYSNLVKRIFMIKVKKSSYNKTFNGKDKAYFNKAKEIINTKIDIWKNLPQHRV